MTPTTSLDCDPLTDKAVAAAARGSVTRCELASTEDVLDKVAAQPGALGHSEPTLATGHEGVLRVPLDGEAASTGHLDQYPYRGVEYAYTHRSPAPGSLAAGFLAHLDEGTSQDVIREQGHLPYGRAAGLCD
ncbi:hypothetical protein OHQ89_24580 [Streptomyces canus]|uniref:hypothetical protein n=1 Tax=Streptomyces canus TaxID=58343 RepID=UPI0030DFB84E